MLLDKKVNILMYILLATLIIVSGVLFFTALQNNQRFLSVESLVILQNEKIESLEAKALKLSTELRDVENLIVSSRQATTTAEK